MAALTNLPFPVEDLSWSKLEDVMARCGLAKQAAMTVLRLVLGEPSVARMNQKKQGLWKKTICKLNHTRWKTLAEAEDKTAIDAVEDVAPPKGKKAKAKAGAKSEAKPKGQPKAVAKSKAKAKGKAKSKPKAKGKAKSQAKARSVKKTIMKRPAAAKSFGFA